MTIAFSTEVKELLLPSGTGFNHLLLTGSVRSNRSVAFHRGFVSHYFLPIFFDIDFLAPFTRDLATLPPPIFNILDDPPLDAGGLRIEALGRPDPPFVDTFFIFIFLVLVYLLLIVP
jgi:hypothetical protein